ncbi:MAG: peptidylprolyl isomerase [Nitriliruptorales bacterium]|nr:peptidylprolyl isomerase [Nitriliruptorales bacterium]
MHRRLVPLVLAAALFVAGCSGATGATAAVVNGEEIPASAVEKRVRARLATLPGQGGGAADRARQTSDLQNQILSQLVVLRIVDQEAEARGITVSEQEVQEAWDEQLALQGGEEALRQAIADAGLTEQEARDQIAIGVKLTKLQELLSGSGEVTEDEVRELYEQRSDQWEQADVSHILVETREEAEQIIDEIEGGASFEEIAEERSQDPGSAARGGNLGSFPRGRYVEEFDQAVWAAEPGEIIGPVETQFGFHVIRVNEFVTTTFDEVAQSLREELEGRNAQQAARDVFAELLRKAEVEVASSFGRWDPTSGSIVATDLLRPEAPNQGG